MQNKCNYTPFARKYRPKSLSDVLGQDVMIRILNNSILQERIFPAYLLHGSRGIGKTTTARIIARLLNCESRVSNKGMLNTCGNCNNCKNFDNHPDIIELDAASNTSVDDARFIINQSEYVPLIGKYKVFIIDEVHMLSKNAFNALLKTLEEPSDNVIFILATTEINKIPPTIISRCQRFDLKKFKIADIKSLLLDICSKESIQHDFGAIDSIAVRSEGSARDALSLLDNVCSYTVFDADNNSGKITVDMINKVLGLIGFGDIFNIMTFVLNKDITSIVKTLDVLNENNVDFAIICQDITDLLAFLSRHKLLRNFDFDENNIYYSFIDRVKTILENTSINKLTILYEVFSKASVEISASHNQRVFFEMICIKAMYAIGIPDLKDLILMSNKDERNDDNLSKSSSSIVIKTDSSENDNVNSSFDLAHLLKYCFNTRDYVDEINLYHYLMNDCSVEIDNKNRKFILTTSSINVKVNSKILEVIKKITGFEWDLSTIKSSNFQSHKKLLLENSINSQMYKTTLMSFANAKVVDVLFDEDV